MKSKHILVASLLGLASFTTLHSADAKTVEISAFDTMKYSVMKIEATPGQKVTVTLKNEGNIPKEAMAHNWVLLKAGEDPVAYSTAAITAKAEGYEPKALASKVLAAIALVGPKESGKVTFTAPTAPGSYNYLCTFPAHCMAGMRGVLVVK